MGRTWLEPLSGRCDICGGARGGYRYAKGRKKHEQCAEIRKARGFPPAKTEEVAPMANKDYDDAVEYAKGLKAADPDATAAELASQLNYVFEDSSFSAVGGEVQMANEHDYVKPYVVIRLA